MSLFNLGSSTGTGAYKRAERSAASLARGKPSDTERLLAANQALQERLNWLTAELKAERTNTATEKHRADQSEDDLRALQEEERSHAAKYPDGCGLLYDCPFHTHSIKCRETGPVVGTTVETT